MKYSIKQAALITGMSAHLIRAWEKRYNAVTPHRSIGERRLYSDHDINRLKLLRDAVESGYRISDIAAKSVEDLTELSRSLKTSLLSNRNIIKFFNQALIVIENYNPGELENILFEASLKLSQDELIYDLVIPLIIEIGERWHRGVFNIAQEHLSTPVLVSFLHYLKGVFKIKQEAPLLLTCAPKGQFHELGALITAVISASQGWRVIHLGTNIPAPEIAATAEFTKAKIIGLSIVYPFDDPELKKELYYLRQNVNPNIKIIAGGRAAESYKKELDEAGINLVSNVNQFNNLLS